MTRKEMIEVIEAYDRGEPLEFRGIAGRIGPCPWLESMQPSFSFGKFEYRIKPKQLDIDALLVKHGIHIDLARAIAARAKNHRRLEDEVIFLQKETQLSVTLHSNGDVQFGCRHFTWEQIDTYAKGKGWW